MPILLRNIIFLLLLSTALQSCGKNKASDASATNSIEGFDLSVFPSPSALDNKFIFRADAAKGATVYYSLRPFQSIDEATAYNGEMLFMPPVTIYLRSLKDGKLGPQKEYVYSLRNQSGDVVAASQLKRVFGSPQPKKVFYGVNGLNFNPDPPSISLKSKNYVIDGKLADWKKDGRLSVIDAKNDMPNSLAATDVTSLYADEDESYFYFALETVGRSEIDPRIAYGIDLGLSNISFESFGPGVEYIYRVELRDGELSFYDRSDEEADPIKLKIESKLYASAQSDGIELKLSKTIFPKFKDKTNLAIQALAGEVVNKKYLVDYTPTLYLRSDFALNRLNVSLSNKREARIEFYADPKFMPLDVISSILGMAKTFLTEIEIFQKISFFEQASIPVFYANSDERGFSGLNASDRGVLTTRVVSSPIIEQAHVLIHEFAHFQNAISSRISQLWLREGFSDWVSENILYEYFPAKTVYEYMRRIRYDNYFSYNQSKRQNFALDKWDIDSLNPGYEKSLMFMNVLAKEVGYDALLEALQAGVNFQLDSKALQSYLEFKTGKDLQELFDAWVFKTQNDAVVQDLFLDNDKDGLMNFDEILLGSDPDRSDSDGDGYLDGEEAFRGRDPTTSQQSFASVPKEQAVVMVGQDEPRSSHLMRLVPVEQNTPINYSLLPYDNAPTFQYQTPVFLRAPFTAYASTSSSKIELARTFFDATGNSVVVQNPSEGILPASSHSSYQYVPDLQLHTQTRLDFAGDVPADFASYDLIDMKVSQTESQTTFELWTLAKPDKFNMYGRYDIKLRSVDWRDNSVYNSFDYIIRVDRSLLSILKLRNGATVSVDYYPFQSKLEFLADRLRISIHNELLSGWLDADMEKSVCAESTIAIDAEKDFKDSLDCFVSGGSNFSFANASVPSIFGVDSHSFELFYRGSTITPETATHLLKLGGSAIRYFSQFLVSPIFDRHSWVMHYVENQENFTELHADRDIGAYLNMKADSNVYMRDYLFVQQLARLFVKNLPTNIGVNIFWTQEALAQWLTMSVLYKVLPTHEARKIYHDWADLYICSVLNTCSSSGGVPLVNITNQSLLNEVNIGKILGFVSYMDGVVGTEVMSKVFSHFINMRPNTDQLKNLFLFYAPDRSDEILTIWSQWVVGNLPYVNAFADWRNATLDPTYYRYEEAFMKAKSSGP